jgi:hypothetical protein
MAKTCKHPWAQLIEIDDGNTECWRCVSILTAAEVEASRKAEADRLLQAVNWSRSRYSKVTGEFEIKGAAYQAALEAYESFTAVHGEPLPI